MAIGGDPVSPIDDYPAQLEIWTPTYLEESLGTDPWQPDTDNDGLTDGHEQFGIPLSRGTS
ncbi:MAG: hypothetical protein U5K37_12410 [Natrialbaceae archaeon]|nr:hypothetical protein [Natrialbaceae archaeon]